ncbi:MAG TPA: ATP-binding protein [Cytophagales bacterium]|nr:ATP-binding protein [Cytophagales bacterium]
MPLSYSNFLRRYFPYINEYNEQDFLKAKIAIASLLNLILLNIVDLIVFGNETYFPILATVNLIVWTGTFVLMFNTIRINAVYKILTIYGSISTSFHAFLGGGLYSSYIMWFLIICLGMSIFFNRKFSILASVYSIISVSFFFYLQITGIVDFKKELDRIPVLYDYFNMISVLIMLAIALYFFFTKENIEFLWKQEKEVQIDQLEHLLELRDMEIKRMRNEMATEFHDEMGNKLALISTYINVLQVQNYEVDPKVKDYLEKININAKSVYEGTRDFIWTIEAEHANFYELGVYLRDFGERFFLPVDVDFFTQDLSEELKKIKTTFIENHQIILIVKEAMTNALKHSSTRKIELKFNSDADFVTLHVKDHGVGFDPENLNRVYGINNMKKRAEKINSELLVNTEVGKGVEIVLKYKITPNR